MFRIGTSEVDVLYLLLCTGETRVKEVDIFPILLLLSLRKCPNNILLFLYIVDETWYGPCIVRELFESLIIEFTPVKSFCHLHRVRVNHLVKDMYTRVHTGLRRSFTGI